MAAFGRECRALAALPQAIRDGAAAAGRKIALRADADIYALRIGNVIEPHEYALFPKWFQDPGFRKKIAWSYIDARDLGELCHRCIETNGLGFQVFNASSGDTSSDLPTAELLIRIDPARFGA